MLSVSHTLYWKRYTHAGWGLGTRLLFAHPPLLLQFPAKSKVCSKNFPPNWPHAESFKFNMMQRLVWIFCSQPTCSWSRIWNCRIQAANGVHVHVIVQCRIKDCSVILITRKCRTFVGASLSKLIQEHCVTDEWSRQASSYMHNPFTIHKGFKNCFHVKLKYKTCYAYIHNRINY